jgi:hypothetical protein
MSTPTATTSAPGVCPRCGKPIEAEWLNKDCGRVRVYQSPPQLHHPEPPYTLSPPHCIACFVDLIQT